MEAKARQTNIKMTARKLRRVINEVRGKAVNDALDMLRFMPYFAARVVEKNLKAAAANAFEQAGVKSDALKVSEIFADESTKEVNQEHKVVYTEDSNVHLTSQLKLVTQ